LLREYTNTVIQFGRHDFFAKKKKEGNFEKELNPGSKRIGVMRDCRIGTVHDVYSDAHLLSYCRRIASLISTL
jgi:hypothetical protein